VALLDVDRLVGDSAKSLADSYRLAEPFPHIVLDNFILVDPEEVTAAFPDLTWEGWTDVGALSETAAQHQPGKHRCREIEIIPSLLQQMIYELSSPKFLRALSDLTGIPKLLPDPFLEGGGIQCTAPGGKLVPHTDFHHPPHLQLFRRANVLLYLNPDWQPDAGGQLDLFNLGDEKPRLSVSPRFGTCVAFTTDHRSLHGVRPIAENAQFRRSIALYYYTVEPAEVFSGDRLTRWYDEVAPATKTSATYKARSWAMKSSLGASKVLTKLAYKMNPQHPVG
jgi:Rps23 Pro-64 3,4-dihydroxylase Tpa1-like proline 4-hydroxylase